ncbi:uncharacterized protein LTR77_011219 [Saxophila tyrrhenica]|uniref:Protein kinase domain-containing protein n=1 Tax=Saxophila tyrrhenica TaxID=1690608 RepID=A0AAV9NTJ8_9PEZI|nr:hypothetical protein LTR77_011219 [Saxophila tyrrhenica]
MAILTVEQKATALRMAAKQVSARSGRSYQGYGGLLRIRRLLTRAAVGLVLLLVFVRELRDRHDKAIREYPIDFQATALDIRSTVVPPQRPVRWFNGTHIDERYRILRHLKAGAQGLVYLCSDNANDASDQVIVKTISANARNPLPSHLQPSFDEFTRSWPSEIEASLTLGGHNTADHSAFVPVLDYFVLRNAGSSPEDWQWTMVTPFVSGGTLVEFSHRLQRVGKSTEQLDNKYRPSLARVVTDLRTLHAQGYCHDDVKPQNLFVQGPDDWLLGDLGNTREVTHGWHDTHLWHRRNQWSDCQLNDIRNALKSYLGFLRDAIPSHDRGAFDYEFLHAANPWSRLYWEFVNEPTASHDVALRDGDVGALSDLGRSHSRMFIGDWARKIAVDHELLCTALWYKLWFTF